MPQIAGVDIYSVRGQIIVMLVEILRVDGTTSRRGAADAILTRRWFDLHDEDWPPYPAQQNREPRWRTLVAWARKDALDHDILADVGRDTWQLSHTGYTRADQLKAQFERGEFAVRRCYMWTGQLKRFMCSTYVPSASDAVRPPRIYEDQIDWDLLRRALDELSRRRPA